VRPLRERHDEPVQVGFGQKLRRGDLIPDHGNAQGPIGETQRPGPKRMHWRPVWFPALPAPGVADRTGCNGPEGSQHPVR
jgi:hypothetical protein